MNEPLRKQDPTFPGDEKALIGAGRAARVYLAHTDKGMPLARKVFTGEGLSKAILFLLTGSANPYTWCKSAIQTAFLRRKILRVLCRFWFGEKLRVPSTECWGWDPEEKAFELRTELIDGSQAYLRNPFDTNPRASVDLLKNEVMRPLQGLLQEAGFDGLVWQAGKGNPVAAANFMLEKTNNSSVCWVWIDLESGVPALFALNLWSTLFYYIPMCVKHRGWLFDNVDVEKLRTYLRKHKLEITASTSEEEFQACLRQVDSLQKHQSEWKEIERHRRGISYYLSQGEISPEHADYFATRPMRWYGKSLVYAAASAVRKLTVLSKQLTHWVANIRYLHICERIIHYLFSNQFRWGVARWYISTRVKRWRRRKQISLSASRYLLRQLKEDDIGVFLTDFSVHIAIKPFVKLSVLVFVPVLLANGAITLVQAGVIGVVSGALARTCYTGWRMFHSVVNSQSRKPWVAFFVGMVPVIGNLAFPVEFVYRSREEEEKIGRFLIYDTFSQLGARIPIWGGEDSETEHFTNKFACYGLKLIARTGQLTSVNTNQS